MFLVFGIGLAMIYNRVYGVPWAGIGWQGNVQIWAVAGLGVAFGLWLVERLAATYTLSRVLPPV